MSLSSDGEGRLAALRRKARSDVDAARRATFDVRQAASQAREQAAKTKQRAKQDAKRVDRATTGLQRAGRSAAATLREAGGAVGAPEAPETTSEIAERAGDAATLRSPIEGTLDPGADGPALERFASVAPGTRQAESGAEQAADEPRQQPAPMGASVGLDVPIVGGGGQPPRGGGSTGDNPRGETDETPSNPLQFEDAFNVTGGER